MVPQRNQSNHIRNYRRANFKIQIFALEDFPVKSTKESVLANISRKSLAISSPSKPSNKGSNEKSVKRKRRVRIAVVLVMSIMTLNWTRILILFGQDIKVNHPTTGFTHFIWALLWMNSVSCLVFSAINTTQLSYHKTLKNY